jgi:RNA polymerase-interacting CarD/CdnL/TRCF family regulator
MNYVNFNNFQPLNETVYTREEAKTAILMVETKNKAKAIELVASLNESGNDIKSILSLVENKLDMVFALKSAKELLERNAFLGALAKARETKAKTFEFNGKEYEVFGAVDVSEEEESVKEALTSKKPNEVETIELDMAWDDSDKEEDKAAKAAFKKYKLTVKGANGQPGTYEVTGKKKDILAYLQSEFYDMDAETVEEYYPELLEACANVKESKNNFKITDFPEGSKIMFNDGEEWLVVKPGLRGSNNRRTADEITIKPFNKLAKDKNVSLPIDINLEFLNANVKSVMNESVGSDLIDDYKMYGKPLQHSKTTTNRRGETVVHAYDSKFNKHEIVFDKNGKELSREIIESYEEMNKSEINESEDYGSAYGLSKAETKKVAETLAKAISKNDGVKCTVNVKTLEEDSFDLDIDGQEFDGGSYNIYDDGSVRNMAVRGEKYGTVKSTVEDFIKGLKKPVKESVINEATMQEIDKKVQKFVIKNANDYEYSNQDSAFQIYLSLKKLYPTLIKESKVNESHFKVGDKVKMSHGGVGVIKSLDKEEGADDEKYYNVELANGDVMKHAPNELTKEANDHEVKMSNGQLLDIAKNASELMTKIGETEKDLPAWIQDHISQAQNFLNQANTGYHELEESTELEEAKKYDLGFGSLGNGTTVWNRAQQVNGDYKTVAHISVGGNITYYDKKMPEDVKKQIEDMAANESVVTEGKVKQFEMDLESMIKYIKRGIGWIDPEYVGDSWENSNDTIDFSIVKAEVFKRLLDAGVLYFSDENGEEKGKAVKSSDLPSIMKMYESLVTEAKKVKFVLYTNPGNSTSAGYIAIGTEDVREVLSDAKRYSDSYKILYQGSGTQADLVKAKNMFSNYSFGNESIDENTDESLLIEKDDAVFIEFLNKDKNFKKDTKHFKSYDEAVKWAKANFDKFSPDMIKYESLEINEKNEVTVSLRYAVQANDIFDDMYRKLGVKESTDVFSFKSKEYAEDFIESLIMVGVPKKEIN